MRTSLFGLLALLVSGPALAQEMVGETGESRMPHGRVTDAQQAHDLWAYLTSFSSADGKAAAP